MLSSLIERQVPPPEYEDTLPFRLSSFGAGTFLYLESCQFRISHNHAVGRELNYGYHSLSAPRAGAVILMVATITASSDPLPPGSMAEVKLGEPPERSAAQGVMAELTGRAAR